MNKSWGQNPTKQQLYGYLTSITKTIKVRRTRHARHCWRSEDDLVSDVFLWTRSHGRAKFGWTARTYIQQFCTDTGCSPEDLPEAMNDREGWLEKVRDIRADGETRWWWSSSSWYFISSSNFIDSRCYFISFSQFNPFSFLCLFFFGFISSHDIYSVTVFHLSYLLHI